MIINECKLKERLKLEERLKELKLEEDRNKQEKTNEEYNLAIKDLNNLVEDSKNVIDTIDEILSHSEEFYFQYVNKPLNEMFPKFGYDIRGKAFYLIRNQEKLTHTNIRWNRFPHSGLYYFFPTIKPVVSDLYDIHLPIIDNVYRHNGYHGLSANNNHYEYEVNIVKDFTVNLMNYIKEFTKIINEI